MFLTKECDYAMRIIRQLSDYEIQTVAEICEVESVPQKFAYKILKRLEHASLLKSFRGQAGGYMLIKDLDSITINDIIRIIDGEIYINNCVNKCVDCPNNTEVKECRLHDEFCRIQEVLADMLSQKSFKDILQAETRELARC
jgi:Rrf2 family protein